ncbi:glutamate 5-kinase [Haloactinopolyspora alba]|uniref:Glutamate 5-kinase n=1 Tax=Haloactinopolyspora alba TaxID=648780 RepID=A0A2P8EBE9_9ACTN|nr:glutamate 5-kinase [Haloactinopolyspora alba]PSL06799.1 glutamate 5-kinase [Haloactinopolyspora alba]
MGADRTAITEAERVVVKIGSSSLTTTRGGIDDSRVAALVDSLAKVRAAGRDVVLVSSGAIAAGLAPLGMPARPRDLARQQAAASVGQGLLMANYTTEFAAHGRQVGQVLLTVDDVTRRAHYRNAYRTLHKLLALGVVPIVNENDTVATHEIRFGDNDRLAALVAQLVHADLLVLLSDVDALYDGDPHRGEASAITDVHSVDELDGLDVGATGRSGLGSGGMQTKVEAAAIATGSGIDVVLTSAPQAPAVLAGDKVGTWFHRRAARRSTRLLWLEYATDGRGTLVLDDGAVRAVVERGASLLPAGITDVAGDFTAGDPVDLLDGDGAVLARGVVNFDASELPALLGRSTKDLARELGAAYEREVVHRDDMVLLRRGRR